MDNLTILLTLKDRKQFTKRWLNWMVYQKCDYKIFIADGDSDKNFTKNLIAKTLYKDLRIEYQEYPFDKDISAYMKKVEGASSFIKSKYVIMADNDDFILIENLKKSVEFFDKNNHFGSITPPHYRFTIRSKSEKVYLEKLNDISFLKLSGLKNKNLAADEAILRMKESIKIFPSDFVYYGLHKTENFKKIFSRLTQVVDDDLIFYEWFITYAYPLIGKIHCPKNIQPFVVRQEGTSTSAGVLPKISELLLRPNWSNQVEMLRLQLFELLDSDNKNKELFFNEFNHSFLEMIKMVNVSAKIGSYISRFNFLYNFASKLYLISRGKKRNALRKKDIKNNENLNALTNFLLSK